MKTPFQISSSTNLKTLREEAQKQSLKGKELNELSDSFDAIQVWSALLARRWGSLKSLVHCSNPDDPPDVQADFTNGTFGIEHTESIPTHIKHSDAIHKACSVNKGRNLPPISVRLGRAELTSIMYTAAHPGMWEPAEDRFRAKVELLNAAANKKLGKCPQSKLLLIKTEIESLDNPFSLVSKALGTLHSDPNGCDWTLIVHDRWNPCSFFSLIAVPGEFVRARLVDGDRDECFLCSSNEFVGRPFGKRIQPGHFDESSL